MYSSTTSDTGVPGRFHHVTYAVDSREDVLRAADICLENGVFIETGPHKHAIQQTFFLYQQGPSRSGTATTLSQHRHGLVNTR